MSALQIAWFALIGILLAGYAILDGYDLGVGFWHLLSRSKDERKALRSAIAPYWDANEVWLITAGGALFAAFPMVYATVFSGFYLPLMLVVFALMFRAVSIEFVEHASSPRMKRFWEIAFGVGSTLPALLFGVAMGNILRGLPLDPSGNYTGTLFDLLNPYSLLIGVTGFALFAMHGALFVQMTQQGELAGRAKLRAGRSLAVLSLLLVASAAATLRYGVPGHLGLFSILACLLPIALLIALIGALIRSNAPRRAFLCSSALIALLFAAISVFLFPNLIPATSGSSLTAADSSSPLTLGIMLGIALVGMTIVLVYTIWVRRVFRGGSVEY